MTVYVLITNTKLFSSGYIDPSPYLRRKYNVSPRSKYRFSVRKEVWQWAWENKIQMRKIRSKPKDIKLPHQYWWEGLEFDREEDAVLFKLIWG